ncbi:unnamed protein product [Effrenium voratum]|uniref:Uncharacterized protein n=1 Tax=Effrenium voratum TaxID=2562239 RepID=A0AA36MXB0_9DINO|nr:unnamed protein product [Effrenium voratum]
MGSPGSLGTYRRGDVGQRVISNASAKTLGALCQQQPYTIQLETLAFAPGFSVLNDRLGISSTVMGAGVSFKLLAPAGGRKGSIASAGPRHVEIVLKHCTGRTCISDDLDLFQQSQPYAPIRCLDVHWPSRPCAPDDPKTDLIQTLYLLKSRMQPLALLE